MGTPAWVVDCQEGKAQVVAHWFVFITTGNDKAAQRPHVSFDTKQRPAEHRVSTDLPVETVAEECADAASPAGMPANHLMCNAFDIVLWKAWMCVVQSLRTGPASVMTMCLGRKACLLASPAD